MAKSNRALVILKRPLEADDVDELAEAFTKAARRPVGPLAKLGVEMAVESVVIRRAAAYDLLAARDEPNPIERHRATMRAIASWRAGVLALESAAKFLAMDGYARVDEAGESVDMHAVFAAYATRGVAPPTAPVAVEPVQAVLQEPEAGPHWRITEEGGEDLPFGQERARLLDEPRRRSLD